MKLARIRTADGTKPAIIDDAGHARDISGVVEDITAQAISPQGLAVLAGLDPAA